MSGILSDVRVLEIAHMVAGPACGQILADLGADVVKLEPPQGDITRRLGPALGDTSALFAATNRSKRSLRADIRDSADSAFVRRLALGSDIVLTNLDRAIMSAAKLDAATLRGEKPALIYIELTGFGPMGPPGTDGLAQAQMGMMSLIGPPEGPAFRTGASVVDVSTGVWGAMGALVALERRRQTGRGDHVHASLADVCLFLQFSHIALYGAAPEIIRRAGNHSHISCTPMFTASDGRVLVTILHDRHWELFCGLVGLPELARDPALGTNDQRCLGQSLIEQRVNLVFGGRTRGDWVEVLRRHRIPCAPERSYGEVVTDPDLRRRGMLFELAAGGGAASLQVKLPLDFAESAPPEARPAPLLGDADATLRSGKP